MLLGQYPCATPTLVQCTTLGTNIIHSQSRRSRDKFHSTSMSRFSTDLFTIPASKFILLPCHTSRKTNRDRSSPRKSLSTQVSDVSKHSWFQGWLTFSDDYTHSRLATCAKCNFCIHAITRVLSPFFRRTWIHTARDNHHTSMKPHRS